MSKTRALLCPHSEICSVCSWISIPYEDQKNLKLQAFQNSLNNQKISSPEEIRFITPAQQALRDRVDLTFENGSYGFYRKNSREVFPIEACPLMSAGLYQFFREVQKIKLPITRGSLRLRISPQGKGGIWLDFANEDIRDLLAEKKTLQAFLDLGYVEIGQRRKKLSPEMKLKDPEFHHWTRTWVQGKPLDLYSTVGSFSQVGDLVNQSLVSELERFFEASTSRTWVEFGAGSGNLTFPLSGTGRSVKALEIEALALKALEKTLQDHPEFKNRIALNQGDYQRKATFPFHRAEGVLVNPPRSGLQNFLDPIFNLSQNERPQELIYMSCFLESFIQDSVRLRDLGYHIKQATLVDQFPHSPHFEILSSWNL